MAAAVESAPQAPAQAPLSFDAGHADMVHDAQLDYYGKRLATCSSDRMIKIFSVVNGQHVHQADLVGHQGPVWQVCWAHPKFGNVLASCSFDRTVIIWKETAENVWEKVYTSPPALFDSSVNALAFAPHELGLHLACASSDGSLAVISHVPNAGWDTTKKGMEQAHPIGCTAVSWAPVDEPKALVSPDAGAEKVRKLVSAGCDNTVKVWGYVEAAKDWRVEQTLEGHTDWVRDAAWAPNLGLPMNTIASCGQDGKVLVWVQSAPGAPWESTLVKDFGVPVWKVSWSVTGNILAVSDGNNQVSLWKENLDSSWTQITTVQ